MQFMLPPVHTCRCGRLAAGGAGDACAAAAAILERCRYRARQCLIIVLALTRCHDPVRWAMLLLFSAVQSLADCAVCQPVGVVIV